MILIIAVSLLACVYLVYSHFESNITISDRGYNIKYEQRFINGDWSTCTLQQQKGFGVIYAIVANNKTVTRRDKHGNFLPSIAGRVYVGESQRTVQERWHEHLTTNGCPAIHAALVLYGKEHFDFLIIKSNVRDDELSDAEINTVELLEGYAKGFNLTKGGFGLGTYAGLTEEQGMFFIITELSLHE